MEHVLKILHIEDQPTDSLYAAHLLEMAGIRAEVTRVETLQGFQHAMEAGSYDLILADYAVPGVEPLQILESARQRRPEVPFIFLSGVVGEDQAIESLKLGATDYVLKHNMVRLVPAVRRALREAEEQARRKVAEAALRESQERFRLFMDHTPALAWVKDADGRYVYLNKAYEQRFGCSLATALGKTDEQLWGPATAARLRQADREALAANHPVDIIEETTDQCGQTSYWHNAKFPYSDAAGKRYVASIGIDITPHKHLEEALREQGHLEQLRADAAQALQEPADIPELLQKVAVLLVERMEAAFAGAWTLSQESDTLHLKASAGLYTHLDGPYSRVRVGQLKVGRIADQRRPLLTNQVVGDPHIPEQDWVRQNRLVSFAGFPLISEGHLLGVIALFARHPLSPAAGKTFEAVAALTAHALARKQTEQALTLEKEFSVETINSLPGVFYVFDGHDRLRRWNRNLESLSGYCPEDIAHMTVLDFIAPEDRDAAAQAIAQVRERGEASAELLTLTKAGRKILFTFTSRRLDYEGLPGFLGVGLDITERKRFEETLRDRETRLHLAVQTAELGTYERNLRTGHVAMNPACQKILGVSGDSFPSDAARQAVHPEDRERVLLEVARAFDPTVRAVCAAEFRILRPDGSVCWVAGRGRVLFDERTQPPRPLKFLGVLNDITDRKNYEDSLRRSQAFLTQTIQVARLGTFERDHRSNTLSWSAELRAILGLPPQHPASLTAVFDRVPPEDRSRLEDGIRRSQDPAGNGLLDLEHRLSLPGNVTRWVSVRAQTFFEGQGAQRRPVRTIGAVLDITDRMRLHAELEHHASALERTVRERTARLQETIAELEGFSYSLVHDMRAPLRAMVGYADILEIEAGQGLNPEHRELLRRIQLAAHRMDQLVTDSLDYSRILRQELPMGPVELRALLRGLLETYPNLQPPVADILMDIPDIIVQGNPAALTQVFSNLLGNAVKFVAPGVHPRVRIWAQVCGAIANPHALSLAKTETGEANAPAPHRLETGQPPSCSLAPPSGRCVLIWIEDNGIGIPKDQQEKIFGMFQRVHRPEEYPGTGIGLALVHKSLARIGGQVCVESEPGKGSRFCVQLPLAPSQTDAGVPAAA